MKTEGWTHRERIERVLAGEQPDRPSVAMWRHFPVDDQDPHRLTAAVAAFQRAFDFDLIKVTPASSYCVKDWGMEDRWEGEPEGTRRYLNPLIRQPEDWERIQPLNPHAGALGETLTTLRQLRGEFETTPILQTIFSPLSQAKNLLGKNNLVAFLRQNPDALHAGLRQLTESTLRYLEVAAATGIDGIFYAVQHAQFGVLSRDEYETFGRAYDLPILQAASGLWLNLLHLHGEAVMFDAVRDYPVQVINWHDRQTSPNLAEAQQRFPGVVCGGLRQIETMLLGGPAEIEAEALDAIQQTGGRRFILGTGCVLQTTTPYGNILTARQMVERAHG
jgi:uroporphyrinogen decarboxylase